METIEYDVQVIDGKIVLSSEKNFLSKVKNLLGGKEIKWIDAQTLAIGGIWGKGYIRQGIIKDTLCDIRHIAEGKF